MTLEEKHITRFNSLNGRKVSKGELMTFHQEITADIKRNKVHSPACKDIQSRLSRAITGMNGHKVMNITCTPIQMPETKPVPSEKIAVPAKKKQPAAKKSAIKKQPAAHKKVSKLTGVVGADQIAKLCFQEIALDGEWKQEFYRLYSDTQVGIWGSPGSGKTVKLLKFSQYLAEKKNLKVLFLAKEELNRSTLTEKINEFRIGHPNLKFTENFEELHRAGYSITDFDVILLDSVQALDMDLDGYRKLVKDHPGRIYFPILQSTKDGKFRGGQDWEHEVDIMAQVSNRHLVFSKNRLDPNFKKKSDQFEIDQLVSEKKKHKEIRDQVKKLTQPLKQQSI